MGIGNRELAIGLNNRLKTLLSFLGWRWNRGRKAITIGQIQDNSSPEVAPFEGVGQIKG
ncbi:hypothetical protein [Microcoleus sp. herbarium12]|uniref:hypothetical protein n=1 Tax=Microcoleus sp. herbarium12 TaxID=3055437 RepID=UPI002FD79181